jgi:hypothetical protein
MCMFSMMNNARLSVGHQGIGIGERAYQQAVAYASERVQGKVAGIEGKAPILHHPDVKRMLMQMRALTEAGRAMSFFTIAAEDRSHKHADAEQRAADAQLVEIMTPLVKGWCTEVSMESTSLGVQVHGGMGFIEETGAAQHMRDARILPIYEGTNGIQALDFIGRKCLRDGGETLTKLLMAMQATAETTDNQLTAALQSAVEQCRAGLGYVLSHPEQGPAVAYNFMMLFGNSVSYWCMVQLAIAAQQKLDSGSDDRFYNQKIATTGFFATQILPRNAAYLASLQAGSASIVELGLEDFVTA